jgi:hypothetical protein
MRKRFALLLLFAVALGLTLTPTFARPEESATAAGNFKQEQRLTSLVLKYTTDAFAPNNRFGAAISGSLFRSAFQDTLDSGVASGDITLLLRMLGLTDLSGTNEPALVVGVVGGTPTLPVGNPATYNGAADLDWWYTQSPAGIDANGIPTAQLTGSIVSNALSVGPGRIAFGGGPLGSLAFTNTRIAATTGAVSTPLTSTNGFPPGHLPVEAIDPLLQSFETMTAGKLAGDIGAAALALAPIPTPLVGTGLTNCSQGYTASNTWLDLLVGGCTILFLPQVTASQPDQADPAAPVAGAGAPYTFTRTGNSVTGCRDKNSVVVDFTTCLNAAAYSGYFQFTSDRIIIPDPAPVSVGGIAEQPDVAALASVTEPSRRNYAMYLAAIALALLAATALVSQQARRWRR